MSEPNGQHTTFGVMTHIIGHAEIVAFSGDSEIVVSVIAHPAGLAGQARGNGAGNCQSIALAFLTAEAAAHASHFRPDGMHRDAQSIRHLVLDFGRVLGRGEDMHLPGLGWLGKCCVAFQVEMLLTTHLDLLGQVMRGIFQRHIDVAVGPDAGAAIEPRFC